MLDRETVPVEGAVTATAKADEDDPAKVAETETEPTAAPTRLTEQPPPEIVQPLAESKPLDLLVANVTIPCANVGVTRAVHWSEAPTLTWDEAQVRLTAIAGGTVTVIVAGEDVLARWLPSP